MSDDGFGPVLRSGGSEGAPRRGTASSSGDDGFGPALRGRGSRLRKGGDVRDVGSPRRPTARDASDRGRPPQGRDRPREAAPRRRRRPVRTFAMVLLVLALLIPLTGLAALGYASARMGRTAVDGLASAPGGQMNILVVGSDSREGLSDDEVRSLGTGRVAGKRTDTIFVLSVRGQQAAMLSFPRDLYVTRCDGSQGRINAAFLAEDGPSCLTQTVAQLSGLPITHYLEIDFRGFVSIVDAVGGVPVYLEQPIADVDAAIDLPAGCIELDGPQALGFVRVRKIDNDLQRIIRQQYFLQQLAREAASPTTILNPVRLVSTAGAVGGSLIADEGFGPVDLVRLGLAGRGLAGGGLPTYTVPATPGSVGGAAVLVPDEGEAAALFSQFADGSVFDAPPPPTIGAAQPGRLQIAALSLPGLLAQPADPSAVDC